MKISLSWYGTFKHYFKVLNCGKWVIKMMKQLFPFLILNRLPKAFCVVFKPVPVDEQNIFVRRFKTPLQLMRNISRSR